MGWGARPAGRGRIGRASYSDRVPGPLQVTPRVLVPEAELSWRFSGRGPQAVDAQPVYFEHLALVRFDERARPR